MYEGVEEKIRGRRRKNYVRIEREREKGKLDEMGRWRGRART